ncbi:MAG TPA: glycosyltransferase family 9 protein [Opitutaceae bacterium]|nr:glycosyltransferase family 9 protein [Opitutaceae bacterium]
MPSRILVVRLSALGDVVLAQPAIQALKAHLSDAQITWLIDERFRSVADAVPGIEVMAISKPKMFGDYRRLWRELNLRNFDAVLAMQANFRVNLLYAGIRAKRKIGFDRRRARDFHRWFVNETIEPRDEHLFDGFAQFAQRLGVPRIAAPETWPAIPVDAATATAWRERRPAGRYVVVHAGASKVERCWPPERYAELARKFATETRVSVVLTGGRSASEEASAKAFLHFAPESLNLCGQTSLTQLQQIIAEASAVISPDTAAVHLARARGVPVIGLYAVARAELSGAYRANEYTVDKYAEAVRSFAGRDPAKVDWHFRVHDDRAMNLITADEVWAKLQTALSRPAIS